MSDVECIIFIFKFEHFKLPGTLGIYVSLHILIRMSQFKLTRLAAELWVLYISPQKYSKLKVVQTRSESPVICVKPLINLKKNGQHI